jgi:hypothetical protein
MKKTPFVKLALALALAGLAAVASLSAADSPGTTATAPAAASGTVRAFVTKGSWTMKIGKNTSTITFRADGTYQEIWRGKTKQGKWSLAADNKLVLKTPDNTTLTFTADPEAGVIRRGKGAYKPVKDAK